MKVIPQIATDFEEYPELGRLADAALRRIVELMEIHDIIELRRVHKTGVFDHPYVKDVVVPIGIPVVPSTISAVRYNVGKTLLDYLETIGFSGVRLEVTQEDANAISTIWAPPDGKKDAPKENTETGKDPLEPKPVDAAPNAPSEETGSEKEAEDEHASD